MPQMMPINWIFFFFFCIYIFIIFNILNYYIFYPNSQQPMKIMAQKKTFNWKW